MEKLLFVGGLLDGQRRQVPPGVDCVMSNGQQYDAMRLQPGSILMFVHSELSPADAMRKLLQEYRIIPDLTRGLVDGGDG